MKLINGFFLLIIFIFLGCKKHCQCGTPTIYIEFVGFSVDEKDQFNLIKVSKTDWSIVNSSLLYLKTGRSPIIYYYEMNTIGSEDFNYLIINKKLNLSDTISKITYNLKKDECCEEISSLTLQLNNKQILGGMVSINK